MTKQNLPRAKFKVDHPAKIERERLMNEFIEKYRPKKIGEYVENGITIPIYESIN